MAPRKLYIFPFNGNGIEALDCLNPAEYEFMGFIDDNEEKKKAQNPWPVYGREILDNEKEAFVLAVPGSPLSYPQRATHIASLGLPEHRFATVIHPGAHIGRQVRIGYNTLIMAGVVITSNARVGNHVCILPNTVIHHDAIVGDYTLIGCNVAVAGGTHIGENCYIGSGTNIINGIKIGDRTLIGLGSNVLRGTTEQATIAGNPAKPIVKKEA